MINFIARILWKVDRFNTVYSEHGSKSMNARYFFHECMWWIKEHGKPLFYIKKWYRYYIEDSNKGESDE